ncbi:hypothetical protein SAMN04489724_4175 [Algoriphagus locisalis]|uniref:Uncharacterized protein n=1 Tax=Algoriphagus locisalis TaxID=305507 RepID=A0A1I7DMS4_9BACT|nr:hypothetical protein [Algoriphagus locisalis]SFU12982.1 hypothetical protein SAMN04489724_4175 [Algoriphagus locisalis]
MKKYLFIIGVGAMLISTSCDPQNEESLFSDVDQAVLESKEGDPNARLGRNDGFAQQKLAINYEVAEKAYYAVMRELPPGKVKAIMAASDDQAYVLKNVIISSMKIFDETVMENGNKMSDLAKRNHAALAGDEHEIEYDLTAGALRAAAGYLKIGDIKGESTDHTYPVAEIFELIGNGKAGRKGNPWNDSIPPVKAPEAAGLGEFILGLSPRNSDPKSLNEGLNQLEIDSGMDPVLAALLLPAIQKVREAAKPNPKSRGKADILIESLSNYGLDPEADLSAMYQIGGMGAIGLLASEDYDSEGDVDWAALQLNRKKFEFEMYLLWEKFWDKHHTDPTTGR